MILRPRGRDDRSYVLVTLRIIPYKDITFDIAKLEGEDDTLESWRKNHEKFFTEEGKDLGYKFSEEMEVIFEEFEVIERL